VGCRSGKTKGKMKKYLRKNELISLIVMMAITAAFMVTCKNQGAPAVKETPTSGDIRIVADESFQPIVDAEAATFTSLYKYAKITPVYKPEKEMIADFLNDSVKVIVTSWTPTEEHKQLLLDALTVIRTTTVAYDALALVMHKSNKDSLLTYDEVDGIFTGKITEWQQINPSSKLGRINIVFDNDRSGNIRYFREKFALPEKLPDNFFAVNNNPEVIEYVSESPDALGIVSVNWISDSDDSLSVSFINKVKVAGVSMQYLDKSTFYLPVQGSIFEKTYPFVREINMVSRETFSGLGSGFITWVSGEQGQRIILKSGLVPATMPIRLIQVKNE
jgi:phosphate transport system substrate-binding protein